MSLWIFYSEQNYSIANRNKSVDIFIWGKEIIFDKIKLKGENINHISLNVESNTFCINLSKINTKYHVRLLRNSWIWPRLNRFQYLSRFRNTTIFPKSTSASLWMTWCWPLPAASYLQEIFTNCHFFWYGEMNFLFCFENDEMNLGFSVPLRFLVKPQ